MLLLNRRTRQTTTSATLTVNASVQGWRGRSGELTGSRRNRPPQLSIDLTAESKHPTSGLSPSLSARPVETRAFAVSSIRSQTRPAVPASDRLGNIPPAAPEALLTGGLAGGTGRSRHTTRRPSDLMSREGADPWGQRREARSPQDRSGRCTSSTCRRRRRTDEPELEPWSGPLSGRARNVPPQPAAVSAQLRVSGPASVGLQGLPDRGTRLPGPRLPDPGDARLAGACRCTTSPRSAGRSRSSSAVSIVGLFWVFGIQVAAIVLAFATVLIGICFLPIRWTGRAAIVGRDRGRPAHSHGRDWPCRHPRRRLAHRRLDVHVPNDHLPV